MSAETIRTIRDGERSTATSTFTPLLSPVRCFMSAETILRTIRDEEPRDGHLDFHTAPDLCLSIREDLTQVLGSGVRSEGSRLEGKETGKERLKGHGPKHIQYTRLHPPPPPTQSHSNKLNHIAINKTKGCRATNS